MDSVVEAVAAAEAVASAVVAVVAAAEAVAAVVAAETAGSPFFIENVKSPVALSMGNGAFLFFIFSVFVVFFELSFEKPAVFTAQVSGSFEFFFGWSGGSKRRHRSGISIFIERDKSEEGTHGVKTIPSERVFCPHVHLDFTARFVNRSERGVNVHNIAFFDGLQKVKFVDTRGDADFSRVALSGDGCGYIDPTHHRSSKNIPKSVGVLRQNHFGHCDFGFGGRPRRARIQSLA